MQTDDASLGGIESDQGFNFGRPAVEKRNFNEIDILGAFDRDERGELSSFVLSQQTKE